MDDALVLRGRGWSLRLKARSLTVAGVLLVGLVAVCVLSLSIGDRFVPPHRVLLVLFGGGEGMERLLVGTLRLPRIVAAITVGLAFGASGALFQALTRNPLGSPDILGVNAGAAFLALLCLIVLPGMVPLPVAGMAGGLIAAVAVATLSAGGGVARLVLVGIGLNFVLVSGVDLLLVKAESRQLAQATVWLTGSLNDASWTSLQPAALGLALFLPVAVLSAAGLDRLALGEDLATSLGIRVRLLVPSVIVAGVGLAALAVTASGPMAFVAFLSGPLARRLARTGDVAVVTAALVGAVLVVVSDLVARTVLAPTVLPVGAVTAVLGGPYLIALLVRQIREGSL